jgi:hypothetical protein
MHRAISWYSNLTEHTQEGRRKTAQFSHSQWERRVNLYFTPIRGQVISRGRLRLRLECDKVEYELGCCPVTTWAALLALWSLAVGRVPGLIGLYKTGAHAIQQSAGSSGPWAEYSGFSQVWGLCQTLSHLALSNSANFQTQSFPQSLAALPPFSVKV